MSRNEKRPAYPAEEIKARVKAIVDTWPPLTAEQKTTLWHALSPMRAAITERKRRASTTGGTDAAA